MRTQFNPRQLKGSVHEGLLWDFAGNEKLPKKPKFCMQAIISRTNLKTREYNGRIFADM